MGSTIRIATLLPFVWLAACGGEKNGETCTPECGDLQCGDDGCGGTCGTCGAPQTCGGTGTPGVCGMPTHSCGMQLNENPVAFCETFDQPNPIFNRSGEMNGDVWGVQRIGGPLNIGQPFAWPNTKLDLCGTMVDAKAESDLRICSGQLREATDDNLPGTFEAGGPTAITMYAKQPFDFKGRTGTIAFDVTNDSAGTHAAWPELWVTDQPVPAPWIHFGSLISHPKNGLAIRMASAVSAGGQGECPTNENLDKARWTVDSAAVIRNFVMEDTVSEHDSTCLGAKSCFTGDLEVKILDCVTEDETGGPNGGFNHVEVQVNKDTIEVYATDAGVATPLKHIASITGANLSFDNGVVWIDDAHYNADKGPTDRPSQRVHTFAWDNIAFDGPLLPRHLSFDVLDSKVPVTDGTGGVLLGWSSTPQQPASVSTLPMTAENIAAASNALLMFNVYLREGQKATFHYSINGHAHTYDWPFPDDQGNTPRTLAIPVDVAELVAGPNAVTLGTSSTGQESGYAEWAHINIALLDAGGVVAPPMGYQ